LNIMNNYKLGSLFDGSGGFPLAGALCGIEPVWASEVEPYPIAVTRSRFPMMKHLGDISKVNGAEIEPVDIITFGSPCQDLSVAGKRAGLKHEANGDEETTRSGLFMEAVRIIKEMRRSTNGQYPRFAIWENVPGAFSSNNGEDFRIVCEELIKIVEPAALMPPVPKNGWAYADSYVGDGWSLSYRVFDAQYWGVPQRRRRIYLVADFRGECAREVLFEREGLRGYFTEGRTPWTGSSSDAQEGTEADDRRRETTERRRQLDDVIDSHILDDQGGQVMCVRTDGKAPTLRAQMGGHPPVVLTFHTTQDPITSDSVAPCLSAGSKNGQAMVGVVKPICLDRAFYNQGVNAKYDPQLYVDECPTLIARGPAAVAYETPPRYIVRRLTPTECARLQGFADWWGVVEQKDTLTEGEFRFWLEVRNTHARINGKKVQEYTERQMLTWYNKLYTDSAEYKMWGNGISLPTALYVLQCVAEALNTEEEDAWML
jgi:DNA (cytosine-5)-methyltransferase 1